MDKINEYLKRTLKVYECDGYRFQDIRPRLRCMDGFVISVQASRTHYCEPAINEAEKYVSVELGFPNIEDPLIIEYAEEIDNPTETVYAYVPIEIVNELIEKHGGIVY